MIFRIIQKIFRRKFIRNYKKYCANKIGHTLLYYKTDPLVFGWLASDYSHTNNLEIPEMVEILNKLGFWVDVIDRTVDIEKLKLDDKYDIFLGIGAGASGKYFSEIAAMIPSAIRIMYALGPDPVVSNGLVRKRYDFFYKRHPKAEAVLRRASDIDINEFIDKIDIFFAGGGSFSVDTYKKYGKDIYRFNCPISPLISTDISQFKERKQNKFLYFGGNGNIVKGLDLMIEAFSKMPELELYICAPDWENDFNDFYKETLENSPNIHFEGFIEVGGKRFNKLTRECGYVVFASCSEGAANSVVVCMRRGLVPILTEESSIDHAQESGYLFDSIEIDDIVKKIRGVSKTSKEEFLEKSVKSYFNSFEHTLAAFSESFEKNVINVILKRQK